MSRVPVPRGLDENISNALREITQRIEKIQNVTDKFSIESDDRGRPRLYVKTPDGKASIGASVEDKGGVDELGRHLDGKRKDIINIRKIKCDELEVSTDSISLGDGFSLSVDKNFLWLTGPRGTGRVPLYTDTPASGDVLTMMSDNTMQWAPPTTSFPVGTFGTSPNYAEFEADGTLVLHGNATGWDDMRFPATAINLPGPAGPPTWDTTEIGWLFSASATNDLQIICQFSHGMKTGSVVSPHIHWEPTNTNKGTVLWRMGWRWRNNGEVAGAFTTEDLVVAGNGLSGKLQIDDWGLIDKTTQAAGMNAPAGISSIFECTLSRIGGDGTYDTYTGTARLKEFDIHFEIDTLGSREEYVK